MNTHAPPELDRVLKPRMLFFRTTHRNISSFIVEHLKQQLDCLRLSFDVTLIEGDCDYDRLCDQHQPDIAMFESGIYAARSRIANPLSHPAVLKVGFFNGDPYCSSRLLFLQEMRRLQIETYFTLSTRLAEYLPSENADIFYWPNFIDPAIHRDYGLPKAIPVLFTGSLASHYPWRNRIRQRLAPRYPIMSCPHPGWFDARAVTKVATGTEYARLINFSHVTPTCGTIADEIVRKHFEIPACRSLLVTERTAGTLAAGFVDLENCLFAEPDDVVEKLEPLLRDPDRMAAITDAGYRLAHERHTIHHRDQVLQWYRLRKIAGESQRIVQPTPFAPLSFAPPRRKLESPPLEHGHLRRLLDQGRRALAARSYDEAARAFGRCLNYHPLPEALVGLARCQLHLGRAREAIALVGDWIDDVLNRYQSAAPDPVEYALLIAGLLCDGRVSEAARRLALFPRLAHPEISWASIGTAALRDAPADARELPEWLTQSATVHEGRHGDAASWLAELAAMMTACGHADLARKVMDRSQTGQESPASQKATSAKLSRHIYPPRRRRRGAIVSTLARTARHKALKPAVTRLARAITRNGRLPRFARLPFARRFRKFDDFVAVLRDLVPRVEASRNLLVPGPTSSIYVDELLAGLAANPDLGSLQIVAGPSVARIDTAQLGAEKVMQSTFADLVEQVAAPFDLVFVEGGQAEVAELTDLCQAAGCVILSGIGDDAGATLCRAIIQAGTHVLLSHDPGYGAGYAVFERWRASLPLPASAPRPGFPVDMQRADSQSVAFP